MKSSYEVSVPGPAAEVWAALTDIDRVLGALDAAGSGASLARANVGVAGSLRCRFGTTQVTYRLTAAVADTTERARSGALSVAGKEARGDGTLQAAVTVTVVPSGPDTTVTVTAEIDVTGRAEGVDAEHWSRILAALLTTALPASSTGVAAQSATPEAPASAAEAASGVPTAAVPEPPRREPPPTPPARPTPDPLPRPGGPPRLVGVAFGAVVLLVLGWVWRRRR